ncbi:hypothetical protein CD122_11710, partial [Staphylococcus rostri]
AIIIFAKESKISGIVEIIYILKSLMFFWCIILFRSNNLHKSTYNKPFIIGDKKDAKKEINRNNKIIAHLMF